MPRFALPLFAAGPAGLAVLLLLALLAMPAGEARAHGDSTATLHAEAYPLHEAAFQGDLDSVNHFIAVHMAEVNATAEYNSENHGFPYFGGTPLHVASQGGYATVAAALIAAGAEVDATTFFGATPLHWTFHWGSTASVVSLLLSAGADANARDGRGWTPLHHWTIVDLKVDALLLLLSAGADVNAKDNDGYTPLYSAVSHDHPPYFYPDYPAMFSVLLSAGADANAKIEGAFGETALHRAVSNYSPAIVSILLSAGADANVKNDDGSTPLHYAIGSSHRGSEMISMLLSAGADVNAKDNKGRTPLGWTGEYTRPFVVSLLLSAGGHWGEACADPLIVNPAGPSPPCVALSAESCGGFNPPQFYDAPQDECVAYPGGDYPLHYAAGRGGNLAAVAQLLRLGSGRGFDVNEKNNFGRTPLYYAAGWGHATIVVTLLSAGADAHAKDNDGETPLHRAADNGHAPVVSLLLSAGAKADEEAGFVRHTPLHLAAGSGHAAVVSLLLSAGAEVNAKNLIDNTPLHHAAKSAHASAVSLLLSARADVNAKNIYGNTPLHETSDAGFSSCAGSAAACAAVRPVLIAAGGHWGEACAGAAVVNPAEPAVPCICESPNVGAADNCQAPSAAACGGLTPAKFYSAEKSACVPYAPCVGGTLNPETNACECPDRLAALGDGVCEYKAATCEMLGGVVEDERVCSGIDINDTFCIVDSDSAFPCLGLFYHVWLCNDRFNRPALDPWHCGKICSEGLRARGAKCAAD